MKKLLYLVLLGCFAACADEQEMKQGLVSDTEISVGEKVMFTTSVLRPASTRGVNSDLLQTYNTISKDYELTIKMLEEGQDAPVGTSVYIPKAVHSGEGALTQVTYDPDGTLELKEGTAENPNKALYWESNIKKYAFEATAGSTTLATDQSTQEKFDLQDLVHGYAFSPVTHTYNIDDDKIGEPNYHSSKDWYVLNKAWREAEGLMPSLDDDDKKASDDYKKIPLFLQHERAWITLILKAGKGVSRESVLAYSNAATKEPNQNVKVQFYGGYQTGEDNKREPSLTIDKPLVGAETVHYIQDSNGGAEDVTNLRYDAIVEPHNYLANPTSDKIASISLSALNFSFYASNDEKFSSTEPADIERMQAYNLTAGKHLIIEATLTSERIVFITAWIEDWKEIIYSTICDDYGQNGDPTVIKTRQELIDFLASEDLNKAGNVAIIAATELDLDTKVTPGATDKDEDVKEPDPWSGSTYQNYTLNATLNLAGATLETSGRLFNQMSSTANLINGNIVMKNTSPVTAAVAQINEGSIDRINVTGYSQASASRAGMVVLNYGSIHDCSSALPVNGVGAEIDYVGGIASMSRQKTGAPVPMIDGCVVSARVKGATNVYGGGIVGQAEGRVTNNTFDYGITLLQSPVYFKNIIAKPADGTLTVSGNSWPTTAENSLAGTNTSDAIYQNVLDCQEELTELLKPQYNRATTASTSYKYRLSDSFTVNSQTWIYGVDSENYNSTETYCNGNLYCELYGNNKTITLDGTATVDIPTYDASNNITGSEPMVTSPMLFSNITGTVQDLTIELAKPLIAVPGRSDEDKLNATDAIAPLAYAVRGHTAKISNVKVKVKEESGAYVQSATPAGLVCWLVDGATVENCKVDVPVMTWMPKSNNTEAKRYVGGVVACACEATIRGCVYYTTTNTLENVAGSGTLTTYYGGILGGTVQKESYDEPKVSIVDCVSKYVYSDASNVYHGSILGNSTYTMNNNTYTGTVTEGDDKCQGNYWSGRGIGTRENGTTIDGVIGKCNSVDPTLNDNF